MHRPRPRAPPVTMTALPAREKRSRTGTSACARGQVLVSSLTGEVREEAHQDQGSALRQQGRRFDHRRSGWRCRWARG
jgi:hypothetical protein